MVRRLLRIATTALLVAVAVAQVAALVSPGPSGDGPAVVGRLTAFDVSTRVLTVAVGAAQERFLVTSETSIRRGSRHLTADGLAACRGARIKVRFHESRRLRVADTVMVAEPSE